MDRTQLLQTIGWRLGDRDDMEARALAELDALQETVLEGKEWHPWFLEKGWVGATTTAGDRHVALPGDFLAELEESHLYLVQTDGTLVELEKKDQDLLQRALPGEGQPRAYAVTGDYLALYPVPDAAYELQMRYYAKAVLISSETEQSPWLTHASDVVLAELGQVLAKLHLKDQAQAAGFAQDAGVAWDRLYKKHVARQEINQTHSMGGNS